MKGNIIMKMKSVNMAAMAKKMDLKRKPAMDFAVGALKDRMKRSQVEQKAADMMLRRDGGSRPEQAVRGALARRWSDVKKSRGY